MRRRGTAAQNAERRRSDGEIGKVDGATAKRRVADGSVENKVVVTANVSRNESVGGKTFGSRWKRPRGSSPRKKDQTRATVQAATRVLYGHVAHRFSDSAQVLVGEHFIELSKENEGGRFVFVQRDIESVRSKAVEREVLPKGWQKF